MSPRTSADLFVIWLAVTLVLGLGLALWRWQ
jgi:hypothetical protein